MKIKFEEKDKELFFSMISSQKIFGELAERLQKEDLEIPYTTIDLIISYLSKIIVDNNYFSISFDENEGIVRSMISFMLGTGIWKFDSHNELWDIFKKETEGYIEIEKDILWNHLLKNGLSI